MIKLNKVDEPQIMKDKSAEWLSALKLKIASGSKPTEAENSRYRHPEVKAALIGETSGKCAYCESFILHVTYGDVEHIQPKSLDVDLRFNWNNLTLSCDVCNTNKGDFFDIDLFVDPYTKNPSEHFWFSGPLLIPFDEAGECTEMKLKLNRPQLLEVRIERIRYLQKAIRNIKNAKSKSHAEILIKDFEDSDISSSSEFAAMSREFYQIAKNNGLL